MNPPPGRRRIDSAEHHRLDLTMALAIDDEENYRAYVTVLARRAGFVVDQAGDGETALSLSASTPYDLLLVDSEMPRLSGLELIERIRARNGLSTVHALMLTAHDGMETKLRILPVRQVMERTVPAPPQPATARLNDQETRKRV